MGVIVDSMLQGRSRVIQREHVRASLIGYAFPFLSMSVVSKSLLHVSIEEACSNVMVRLPCHLFQQGLQRSRGSRGSRGSWGFGVLRQAKITQVDVTWNRVRFYM